jgi:hypothetical protein
VAQPDQPVYYSDGIDPIQRSSPAELFLVTLEARPEPDSDEYKEAGGAFVNCWVNADDLRTAERRAVALVREAGWRPHRFDAWEIVTRDTYANSQPSDDAGPDLLEIVAQAFTARCACFTDGPSTRTTRTRTPRAARPVQAWPRILARELGSVVIRCDGGSRRGFSATVICDKEIRKLSP